MSEERLNEALRAFEAGLAALRPQPAGLDRDRLMFLAGQAAAGAADLAPTVVVSRPQPVGWRWPCATVVSLLVAVAASSYAWFRGGPQTVDRPVYVERSVPAPAAVPIGNTDDMPLRADYLRLRQLVLTQGVEALPAAPQGSAGSESPAWRPSRRQQLHELLGG